MISYKQIERELDILCRLTLGRRAECDLEDILYKNNVPYEDHGFDDYDSSLELYGVPPDYRLNIKIQEDLFNVGFKRAYLNHTDKWETHYSFGMYDPETNKVNFYSREPSRKDRKLMSKELDTTGCKL